MKLYCFGCSLTYGQGLEDCHRDISKPSNFAWPAVLGKMLDIEVINKGDPGASNKQIWKTVVETEIQETDAVVIQWSHIDRFCRFENDDTITKIGIWRTKKDRLSNWFFKNMYTETDMVTDLHLRANHIKNHLDKKNIKNFQLVVSSETYLRPIIWSDVDFLPVYLNAIRNKHPRALDKKHPGKDAQKEYAELIYEYVQNYIK